MKGQATVWLFIGRLKASVKFTEHKAAGWSHTHTFTSNAKNTFRAGQAVVVVAAGDDQGDERSGSVVSSTLSSSGGSVASLSSL